jgi:hypothetical protein
MYCRRKPEPPEKTYVGYYHSCTYVIYGCLYFEKVSVNASFQIIIEWSLPTLPLPGGHLKLLSQIRNFH